MKRVPVVSTIVVFAAALAMVGLGIWQLQRRDAKQALLATIARNAALPEMPLAAGPVADTALFRPVRATCSAPDTPTRSAGRSEGGMSGYRFLVRCREGVVVDLGVASDPRLAPAWPGGAVRGILTRAPDSTPFIARLFGARPNPAPMIVPAAPLAPGLSPSRAPDPANVPDNHLAYAVQWFAFALLAVVIYGFALRRRR